MVSKLIKNKFDIVIHFAAFTKVGESVNFQKNILTIILIKQKYF